MKIVWSIERPLKIHYDNTFAVFFAKNNKRSKALRLMDIKYLKVQDQVRDRVIDIEHISTHEMVAYPLTKVINVIAFNKHVMKMGLQPSMELE